MATLFGAIAGGGRLATIATTTTTATAPSRTTASRN
jgi:hypothetical protein